jgi:glycosyltransferase involved in cell wall biosynthesis
VSIIVATYNCGATIEETILSVTEQEFPAKELIIIDGGSTDDTLDVIKNHDQVIDFWSSEPDRGIYDAFNKGIARACGEWLYFLGGDDRFADREVLRRIFSRPLNGKIIYGNVLLEGEGPMKRTDNLYDGRFTPLKLCLRNICQQAIFYHKSLFSSLGPFELKYPLLADYAFNLRAFAERETKPLYINTVIAVFWNEGLSGQKVDPVFEQDRPALVKQLYGFPYYLFFSAIRLSIRMVIWGAGSIGLKTKWRNKKLKMRLLTSYTSYPADRNDWRGVFIYNLATALGKCKELEIKAWGPPGVIPENIAYSATSGEAAWLANLMAAGGIAHLLRTRPLKSLLYHIPRLLYLLGKVYRRSARSTDLYHVHWLQNAIPLGTKSRQPLVISVLGGDLKLAANPLLRHLIRRILKKRRAVLCPNGEWMVPLLEDYFGDYAEIVYVPFGIGEEWFKIERTLPGADYRWLTVLRMTRRKVGRLFDWGEELFTAPHRLTWLGPRQEEISPPPWLDYQGATNPDELRGKWFPGAAGLISLSEHDEGQPQIILEAMAAGLPVIASDIPAHRSLIKNHQTGILVGSKEELKAALTYLAIKENNEKIGMAARKRVRAEFGTWDDCAARYRRIYKELVDV